MDYRKIFLNEFDFALHRKADPHFLVPGPRQCDIEWPPPLQRFHARNDTWLGDEGRCEEQPPHLRLYCVGRRNAKLTEHAAARVHEATATGRNHRGGVSNESIDLRAQFQWQPFIVGIKKCDELAPRDLQTFIDRAARSLITGKTQQPDSS